MVKKLFHKIATCSLAIAAISLAAIGYTNAILPDSYQVYSGQTLSLGDAYTYDMPEDTETLSTSGASYQVQVKLFGVLPVKQVDVNVIEPTGLIPCGTPFGVKMFTQGVLVVSMTDVQTADGMINPAKKAGIQIGDVITHLNGTQVNTNEQVASLVEKSGGQPIAVKAIHKNQPYETTLTPVVSVSHTGYRAGMWVRDSSAGIGTLTFIDPKNNVFGGLGHAICDIDTGEIMPLMTGEVVKVSITDVIKAQSGAPGELHGTFDVGRDMGKLMMNGETGVFGVMYEQPACTQEFEVGLKQEVKAGEAEILSTVDGSTPEKYKIKIERVSYQDSSKTKNMVIRITDERLLQQTGGIVQGMSGSPIIQNGKIIGAVTHVFVNDPVRGYGIFIENMVDASKQINTESVK